MAVFADIVSWACLLAGSAFALIGAWGVLRLPDVFARMHGAGMIDTMGLGLIMIGLMFQAGLSLVTVKLFLLLAFVFFTSPATTHALAQACLGGKVEPQTGVKDSSGGESSKA